MTITRAERMSIPNAQRARDIVEALAGMDSFEGPAVTKLHALRVLAIELKADLERSDQHGRGKATPAAREASAAVTKAMTAAFRERLFPIIRSLRAEGITSVRGIRAALMDREVLTERGGTWSASTVHGLIKALDEADRKQENAE